MFDVRGSVHHSTILTVKTPTRCNIVSKFLLFLILNEVQHVSSDTPPVIRSIKLHKQPLVLHTWKVVGRADVGCCQVAYATRQRHTALHQEHKTTQEASGFAYVEGCRTCSCWMLSGSVRYLTTPHRPSSEA